MPLKFMKSLSIQCYKLFLLSLSSILLVVGGEVLAFDHEHQLWTALLQEYVNQDGQVNYQSWQREPAALKVYLHSLESVSYQQFTDWSPNQKKAFLINAYNAYTIYLVLDHYPLRSIRQIGGLFRSPWKLEFFSLLDGRLKALDPIEHDWLRKIAELKDPRIHAVVNCASVSCPKLINEAFVASKLDEQMDAASRMWLADPKRNRFVLESNKVQLSKIFDWYQEDFGGGRQGVVNFIRQYGPQEARKIVEQPFRIEYLKYDWNLNEWR